MEGKLNGVLLMRLLMFRKLTAHSYSLARDAEDTERFIFMFSGVSGNGRDVGEKLTNYAA